MKKRIIIVLSIVLILAILIGVFLYMNWNTIQAVMDGMQYTTEEVEQQLQQSQNELQRYIDSNEKIVVRDLTDEEKDALNSGEITSADAIKILTGKKTLEDVREEKKEEPNQTNTDNKTDTTAPSENEQKPQIDNSQNNNSKKDTPKPQEPVKEEPKDSSDDAESKVSELIASLYVTKNMYMSRLDGLEAELGAEFEKVASEDKQAEKQRIIAKYTPIIGAWERECDNAVYAIINQIEAELKNSGQDLEMVTKIKEAYKSEKRAKKAYYVSNYM